jgi:hypothetical protein
MHACVHDVCVCVCVCVCVRVCVFGEGLCFGFTWETSSGGNPHNRSHDGGPLLRQLAGGAEGLTVTVTVNDGYGQLWLSHDG